MVLDRGMHLRGRCFPWNAPGLPPSFVPTLPTTSLVDGVLEAPCVLGTPRPSRLGWPIPETVSVTEHERCPPRTFGSRAVMTTWLTCLLAHLGSQVSGTSLRGEAWWGCCSGHRISREPGRTGWRRGECLEMVRRERFTGNVDRHTVGHGGHSHRSPRCVFHVERNSLSASPPRPVGCSAGRPERSLPRPRIRSPRR